MIRDNKYLSYLRGQSCIICGRHADENMTVEPCHIGTAGKGLKSSDNEAIPMCHAHHYQSHNGDGEMSFFRRWIPNTLLREALRAWAREQYDAWKDNDRT